MMLGLAGKLLFDFSAFGMKSAVIPKKWHPWVFGLKNENKSPGRRDIVL
jgi:hypothetical protein